jgi:hypothetical protein
LVAVTSTEPTLWNDDDAEHVPAIVVEQRGGEVVPLTELTVRARAYARSSKAANTLRAYDSDLRHFGIWCEARPKRNAQTHETNLQLRRRLKARKTSGPRLRPA